MRKTLSLRHVVPVGVFLLAYTAVSLFGHKGFVLTAISDGAGTALWLVAVVVMVWAAFSNHGRVRWFWLLLALAAATVGVNLGAWFSYDVLLKRPVGDPFWADIPLFLQPVPIMAAAAMRPNWKQEGQKFQLATLNFLILLSWWLYIYAFFIYPKEYILPNAQSFNTYYDALFLLEFAVVLSILGFLAWKTQGAWRGVYGELLLACGLYIAAFMTLNIALRRGFYYGVSFYDVPVYASMCWFILIPLRYRSIPGEQVSRNDSHHRGLWGLISALAVLSLPIFGIVELFTEPRSSRLFPFRVAVTLIGVLLMAIFVFFRQMLLAQERELLLCESKQNLQHLKEAQAQLVQQERLAGIGQLVSGVAHELNNPLTAVIGYSDLLAEGAEGKARERLQKLGSEARRIKRIVSNLASFAQPRGGESRTLDVATLVQDSLMLCGHQLRACGATVRVNLAPGMPHIVGHEGQLKEVFVNLFSNCGHALEQAQEKTVRVDGFVQDDRVIVRVCDSGPGFTDVTRAFDPFYTTQPVGQGTGLGLSVCYGTIRNHGGNISIQNLEPHGACVSIELPASPKPSAPPSLVAAGPRASLEPASQ